MISRLPIKKKLAFITVFSTVIANAQIENTAILEPDSSKSTLMQYFAVASIGYRQPLPAGNNFIGRGMTGNSGFDLKMQVFVYKQFFIGGTVGASYFDVKTPEITGNYKKTTVKEQYLFFGYEFLLSKKVRLGAHASLIGNARYKNKIVANNREAYQTDQSRLANYGLYVNYRLDSNLMLYFEYGFRSDAIKIKAPNELQNVFERGTFHNLGIGLKIGIGNKAMF